MGYGILYFSQGEGGIPFDLNIHDTSRPVVNLHMCLYFLNKDTHLHLLLEYTDVPNVFFTLRHVGHTCTNDTPESRLRNNVPTAGPRFPLFCNHYRRRAGCLLPRNTTTDADEPIKCSSLAQQRE
jgi:hypothetical protein